MKKLGNLNYNYIFIICIISLIFSSCVTTKKPSILVDDKLSYNAVDILGKRVEQITSFAARGRVTYKEYSRKTAFSFELINFGERGQLLTVFDPAGKLAFKLIADGNDIVGLYYRENKYIKYKRNEINIADFLVAGLNYDELMIVLGFSFPKPTMGEHEILGKEFAEFVEISFPDKDHALLWSLLFDPVEFKNPNKNNLSLLELKRGVKNKLDVKIIYKDWRNISANNRNISANNNEMMLFPYAIKAFLIKDNKELDIAYDEVVINPAFNKNLFKLPEIPPGFTY